MPVPGTMLGKARLWEADTQCLGGSGKLGEAPCVAALETVGVFSLPSFEGLGWLPGPDRRVHVCVCTGSCPCVARVPSFTLLHRSPRLDCSGVLRRSVLGLSWLQPDLLGS